MVRISDILKRGRKEEEGPQPKKPEEAPQLEKKETSFAFPKEKLEEKQKVTAELPSQLVSEEKKEEKPAHPVEISHVVTERTKADRAQLEKLYSELLELIKNIFAKGTRNEPIEGKEIVWKIDKLVDVMSAASNELLALTEKTSPENYLYTHMLNVCILSLKIGLALGYKRGELSELGIAALLHDIGMVKVMNIAQQPRRLTSEEYETVKQHPVFGTELLGKIKDLAKAVIYVAHEQHERVDGSGYPRGLRDGEINEYARIVGMVDVYEAMTHPRPYRKKFAPFEAMKETLKSKQQFDPKYLKLLIQELGVYPIGSWVELNTAEIGKVAKVEKGFPLQPTVKVFYDFNGLKLEEEKSVDLVKHPTLYVKRPLDEDQVKEKIKDSSHS